MLIIFDLDDTLIDTSGSIIPFKLERAFFEMKKRGADFKENDLDRLMEINKKELSSKDALKKFLKDYDKKFFEMADKIVYSDVTGENVLELKGANKILKELKLFNKLALVSFGRENNQLKKMEKAGIDCDVFCIMRFLEEGSKRQAYLDVLTKLGFLAEDSLVCGDRSRDLIPASDLNMKTIRMRYGRGVIENDFKADFEVNSLFDVKNIIFECSRRGYGNK